MPALNGPAWKVERDDLVTLLRMAADTSGTELSMDEQLFLERMCTQVEIDPALSGIIIGSPEVDEDLEDDLRIIRKHNTN
jgi:hypothetical protein